MLHVMIKALQFELVMVVVVVVGGGYYTVVLQSNTMVIEINN